jgi:hypothetical protein
MNFRLQLALFILQRRVEGEGRYQVMIQVSLIIQKIQALVFWVVMPCRDAEHQRYRGPCHLHHQGEVNGARKGDTDIGMEYKRGRVHETKQEESKDSDISGREGERW